MPGVNREYKDRLFRFIFGNENNKEWTLSLYNAVNSSSYTNTEDMKFTTIDDVLYMGMKNDVSFLVGDTMNLYEQQSTYNPNMPMRFLIYSGMVYSRYIQDESSNYYLYSSRLQKAPSPRCICFYNGRTEKDDRTELRLSEAFGDNSDIEVRVTMININFGHNRELLERCKPLGEYSWFTDNVNRKQREFGNPEKAVDAALDEMPDGFLIKPFLIANKAEVKSMCLTEYDEAKCKAMDREEGRAEGRAEGRMEGLEEGTVRTLLALVKDGIISEETAAGKAKMSVAEFRKAAERFCQ